MGKFRNFISVLGPGLLYAGAAIGVSHLVQSTRAGAEYEFGLIWVPGQASFFSLVLLYFILYGGYSCKTHQQIKTLRN